MPSNDDPVTIRRAGPDFRFPSGARIGIVFNIAYEAWSPGKAPPIGPMGNVLQPGFFDTNAHSWASYGAVRGIQRLLRISAANRIKTSVMVSGVLAERFPDSVRAIHDQGHEIVAHSYGMDVIPVYLDEPAQIANIRRNTALVKAAAGIRPTGWISPRGTGSPASPRLLAAEGYEWHGDCNDDDLPAIWEYPDGARTRSIVAIPLTMDVNDLPHSNRYGGSAEAFVAKFQAILEGAAKADQAPFMLDVTAHTHVYGRPAGAWAFDACMKIAQGAKGTWIGTRGEMVAHALASPGAYSVAPA